MGTLREEGGGGGRDKEQSKRGCEEAGETSPLEEGERREEEENMGEWVGGGSVRVLSTVCYFSCSCSASPFVCVLSFACRRLFCVHLLCYFACVFSCVISLCHLSCVLFGCQLCVSSFVSFLVCRFSESTPVSFNVSHLPQVILSLSFLECRLSYAIFHVSLTS